MQLTVLELFELCIRLGNLAFGGRSLRTSVRQVEGYDLRAPSVALTSIMISDYRQWRYSAEHIWEGGRVVAEGSPFI